MTDALATETACIDLPLQTRADVRLQPDTIDAEARTVEVVWSTGATVRRRDLWTGKRHDELLSLEPAHVDLSRLNNGAPLLNTHGAFDLAGVIGVVERAWIARAGETYEGRALVRFSVREDVEPLWQDVRAGIIRNVSVGYTVRAYEVIEQDGQVPVWRAIDWQPVELSAVPIGADDGAGFRQRQDLTPCRLICAEQTCSVNRAAAARQPENQPMDKTMPAANTSAAADTDTPLQTQEDTVTRESAQTAATAAPESAAAAAQHVQTRSDGAAFERADRPHHPDHCVAPTAATADTARRAVAEERARIAGIYDVTRKLAIETGIADDLVRRGITLDEARTVLIDRAAERDRAVETRPHIRTGGSTRKRSGAARWRRRCCTASIRIATRSARPPATGAAIP